MTAKILRKVPSDLYNHLSIQAQLQTPTRKLAPT